MSDTPAPVVDPVQALYSDHHAWLLDWLRRRLSCSEQAADLAQDTFVRLISGREQVQPVHTPRAYLTRIAKGLVIDHWRRQDVERAYLQVLQNTPQAQQISLEERYLLVESLVLIDRMLAGLRPRVRQIFLCSQLQGMTYPQIASDLQVSVNVVQKAMVQALQHCYRIIYE